MNSKGPGVRGTKIKDELTHKFSQQSLNPASTPAYIDHALEYLREKKNFTQTDYDIVDMIIRHGDPDAHEKLLNEKFLSSIQGHERSVHKIANIDKRAAVADLPNLTEPMLIALIRDDHPKVRAATTNAVNMTEILLTHLSRDPDPIVRAAVPGSKHVTEALLKTLSKDPDPNVRIAVVNSEKATADILQFLYGDKNKTVRGAVDEIAQRRRKKRQRMSPDVITGTSKNLLPDMNSTDDEQMIKIQLDIMAKSDNWESRKAAANSKYVSEDILKTLSEDPDPNVRIAVARSKNVTYDILTSLAFDADPDVLATIREIREELEEFRKKIGLSAFVDFVPTTDRIIEILKDDRVTESALRHYASDTDPRVRIAVTQSDKTSPDVLYALKSDHDPEVRHSAKTAIELFESQRDEQANTDYTFEKNDDNDGPEIG